MTATAAKSIRDDNKIARRQYGGSLKKLEMLCSIINDFKYDRHPLQSNI